MDLLTRSTLEPSQGTQRDPKTGRLFNVYQTMPTNGSRPVFFVSSFENLRSDEVGINKQYTVRLSANVVELDADSVLIRQAPVSVKIVVGMGALQPTAADLRLLLASAYSMTYPSVSSGAPATGYIAKMLNGSPVIK